MKKKVLAIATVLMMMAAPAMAQVFLDDDDTWNNRAGESSSELLVDNPAIYDSGEDWFVPVGEGVFFLAGLAGAYLLGKRKDEE